jgi:hypothetical protein
MGEVRLLNATDYAALWDTLDAIMHDGATPEELDHWLVYLTRKRRGRKQWLTWRKQVLVNRREAEGLTQVEYLELLEVQQSLFNLRNI